MGQDYMRTASAKGLTGSQVIWRHGLKNALIPVVTFFGLDLGAMMGGTILTETVFNWPGVGYQIYQAILSRDWPIVMGGDRVSSSSWSCSSTCWWTSATRSSIRASATARPAN